MKVFINGVETSNYVSENGVITLPPFRIKEGWVWKMIAKVSFLRHFAVDDSENIFVIYE